MTRLPLAAALALLPASLLAAPLPAPEFLGQIVVPSALSFDGAVFGGISDLSYDAATGRYLAICDDRSQNGPARAYDLGLSVAGGIVSLDIGQTILLRDENNALFAEKGADPEGIAWDGTNDVLYWSSERDAAGQPAIYATRRDGSGAVKLALPEAYLPNAEGTRGVYSNLAFEGLTLAADGMLVAGTENALIQDGPKATLEAGSAARLLVLDPARGEAVAEYFYPTEAIYTAATSEPAWNDNGLSAIEALPDGRLVVVERSFATGAGNHIRVFVADLSAAQNILGAEAVDPAEVVAVAKTPWFEIGEGDYGLDIDNIESFAFGPVTEGQQLFVIASDDNFNPATQFTQFAVFAIPAL